MLESGKKDVIRRKGKYSYYIFYKTVHIFKKSLDIYTITEN